MTICAALICKQGAEYVIVGVADRMYTRNMGNYQIEYECYQSKAHFFRKNIMALAAGDGDFAHEICCLTQHEGAAGGLAKVSEIAELCAEKHAQLRSRRTGSFFLGPLGLTHETFVSKQRKLDPALVADTAHKLQHEDWHLRVETLVFGIDSTGPHIYHVYDPGLWLYRTKLGYLAIGMGALLFETTLTSIGHFSGMPLMHGLMLMMSAKRQAERAPGVGKATDIFIIREQGWSALTPEQVHLLGEHHSYLSDETDNVRNQVMASLIAKLPPEKLGF